MHTVFRTQTFSTITTVSVVLFGTAVCNAFRNLRCAPQCREHWSHQKCVSSKHFTYTLVFKLHEIGTELGPVVAGYSGLSISGPYQKTSPSHYRVSFL